MEAEINRLQKEKDGLAQQQKGGNEGNSKMSEITRKHIQQLEAKIESLKKLQKESAAEVNEAEQSE